MGGLSSPRVPVLPMLAVFNEDAQSGSGGFPMLSTCLDDCDKLRASPSLDVIRRYYSVRSFLRMWLGGMRVTDFTTDGRIANNTIRSFRYRAGLL